MEDIESIQKELNNLLKGSQNMKEKKGLLQKMFVSLYVITVGYT